MKLNLLQLNKEYKYKELCEVLDEPIKKGGAKQLQLENWKNYFKWINPTSHKFIIIEIYEVPKEKVENRGGARDGAGKKPRLQDEFEHIFNRFLNDALRKREYYRDNKYWNEAYFNNDVISRFFGCYSNLYAAMDDECVNKNAFSKLSDKIREKVRYYIHDKIKRLDWVEKLEYGIIAYPDKTELYKYEFKDELLDQWNQYEQEFIKENKLGFEMNVIKQGRWQEMIEYISDKFDGYDIVKRYHKVIFEMEKIKECDNKTYKQCRHAYNKTVIEDVYGFILKKEIENFEDDNDILEAMGYDRKVFNEIEIMKPYKYIIDNYIKLK